nr:FAD-dependent oxidoreductase [uncultured Mediterraneibacter sp.]
MESIWSKTYRRKKYAALNQNIETEVAVIGGGMAGILTAWQLERAGARIVVLEADQIGGGQTKNTTAKITSQHGLFCHSFIEKKGEETARKYVQANQYAVEEYKKIVRDENIDCDLTEADAYVYSDDGEKLKMETEAAQKLGIDASFKTQIEIPVPCAGAVCFPNQAQFHPLKFIEALSEHMTVYEDTPVTDVEGNLIKTSGGSVRAEKIVFAAHFPFINFPGMYFARMHQERSYVLALEGAGTLNGMYIGAGKDTLSFRQYDKYILLGGQGHRTGENREDGCYERLKVSAEQLYPGSCIAAQWSAQDCITSDGIPFIGQYAADRTDWYVATGFQKWGMSSSMVSAMLLRDMICGKENPFVEVFAPSRFSAEELPQILKDSGKAVKGLTKRFFHLPDETVSALERGHGAVVDTPQGKAGVYKTEEGEIYQVDIVCPHMGCELVWNPDEHSWDCPCHGSRFDCMGNLLDGPAQEGIQNK